MLGNASAGCVKDTAPSCCCTVSGHHAPAEFKFHRPAEVLDYLSIVERVDARTIRFTGQDMIEVSKFLEFITTYRPDLEP